MKTTRILMVFLASGFSIMAWSQGEPHVQGLRFYENLAHKDAQYEWSLQNTNTQDEFDYWTDQKTYERHLGKANFTAYLVYMKGKKEAYLNHLQECSDSCSHSDLHFERIREYLSTPDSEYLFGEDQGKVVQNLPKKKKQ